MTAGFGKLLAPETFWLAGGIIAGNIVTNYALSRVPALQQLPGMGTPLGRLGYSVAIPVLASGLVKRLKFRGSDRLAVGLVASGALTGMQYLLAQGQTLIAGNGATAGAGAYLDAPPIPGVSALPALRPGGPANSPGYDAIDAFGSIYQSEGAFSASAWGE